MGCAYGIVNKCYREKKISRRQGRGLGRTCVGVFEESPKEGRVHQAGAQPKQRSGGGRWEPLVSRRTPREQVLGGRNR